MRQCLRTFFADIADFFDQKSAISYFIKWFILLNGVPSHLRSWHSFPDKINIWSALFLFIFYLKLTAQLNLLFVFWYNIKSMLYSVAWACADPGKAQSMFKWFTILRLLQGISSFHIPVVDSYHYLILILSIRYHMVTTDNYCCESWMEWRKYYLWDF